MRKPFRHIIPLLLLVSACEIPFSLEDTASPKIFIQCIPSQENGTALQINYAAPAVGHKYDSFDFRPNSVDIFVNGVAAAWKADTAGTIRCLAPLKEGDEIRVEVTAPDLEPVSGTTTVPPAPVIADAKWEMVKVDTVEARKVTITLDRAPVEGEFYGLQIHRLSGVLYDDGSIDRSDLYTSPGAIMTAIDAMGTGADTMDSYISVNYNGGLMNTDYDRPLTLLTYKQFQGKEYSFYLDSYDTEMLNSWRDIDWENLEKESGNWGGGNGDPGGWRPPWMGGDDDEEDTRIPVATGLLCEFFVYRLSPELYYYAKAMYLSNFDFLANMGLVPANFTYSNVEGGVGVVGALSVDSTVLTETLGFILGSAQ